MAIYIFSNPICAYLQKFAFPPKIQQQIAEFAKISQFSLKKRKNQYIIPIVEKWKCMLFYNYQKGSVDL